MAASSISRTHQMDHNLENRIRERAYELWKIHGCTHGEADRHWFAAEREVLAASTATVKPPPQKQEMLTPLRLQTRANRRHRRGASRPDV